MTPTPVATDLETAKFLVDIVGVGVTVAVGAIATWIAWLSWKTSKRSAETAEKAEATARSVAEEQSDRVARLERVEFVPDVRLLMSTLTNEWDVAAEGTKPAQHHRELVALQEKALSLTGANETAALLMKRVSDFSNDLQTRGHADVDREAVRKVAGGLRLGITAWVRDPSQWDADTIDIQSVVAQILARTPVRTQGNSTE
jgi:hypothetical protein